MSGDSRWTRRDPLFRGCRLKVFVTFVFEGHPHRVANAGIVIYQENARCHNREWSVYRDRGQSTAGL